MSGTFFLIYFLYFSPPVVPGKRHRADCQGLGDSACQNLLFDTASRDCFSPRQIKWYISSGLSHSDSFAGLCSLMGGFPNIQDILQGFLPP